MSFKALVLREQESQIVSAIEELNEEQLPAGDVTVAVEYSNLNYKDGLVVQGLGRLVKDYPHVPGIDFAGKVIASYSEAYDVGDAVVLTGWRVGEIHWGGYAQRARVKADWLVPMPTKMSSKEAMSIGTAGFTAMLGITMLEDQGLSPADGPVLVTGASGGVGSIAVAALAKMGYEVAALTGRAETHDYLKGLGASQIVDRAELAEPSKRPLERETWAACIDNVGGTVLARALAQMRYNGAVAAIGLAGGNALNTTVIPFLLRGVKLLGVDSVMCPKDMRVRVWQRIQETLDSETLAAIANEISLSEVSDYAAKILQGQVQGRTLVNLAADASTKSSGTPWGALKNS